MTKKINEPLMVKDLEFFDCVMSMPIYAANMTAATTNGAAISQIESTTNAVNYHVADFDGTTSESLHFMVPMPKSWDKNTVKFEATWTTEATDTDGVAWGLSYLALKDGETLDQAFTDPVIVTDLAQGAAGKLLVTDVSDSLDFSGAEDWDQVLFKLSRVVSDDGDTMAEDARLISLRLLMGIDNLNER